MDGVTTGGLVSGIGAEVPVLAGGVASSKSEMDSKKAKWSYEEAFRRNRGLITEEEQQKLRNSRVAIAGMGGVGGVHLITLTRLGIGKFTIADPDVFDVANFNRQYGATISNLGRNKSEVMAEAALDINPELELRVFPNAIDESNINTFLKDADLVVDGLDFFAIEARRMLFRRTAELGIWAVTAGPIGFSTAWLAFDPRGMTFDEYFDLNDSTERIDQLAAFAVGLTPKATHLPYTDLSFASLTERTGPCSSIGCQLAAGVTGSESLKVLLKRDKAVAVPEYLQFDAYRNRLAKGRLLFANRSLWQRLKRRILKNRFAPGCVRRADNRQQGLVARTTEIVRSIPPIHRYIPLIIGQTFSRQSLERVPEPRAVTDQPDNVLQYDQVMKTKLAIAYAVYLEMIYRARMTPFGGKAIDLACGPGHLSLCMAEYLKLDQLMGIDLSQPMIEAASANADSRAMSSCLFQRGDVTNLAQFESGTFDLCVFADAAHHMPGLETVATVLSEMDRITKPNGLVFVADLARLKNENLTRRYVSLVGRDYNQRGLTAFHRDFQNSMYAAWTPAELKSAIPMTRHRQWIHWAALGLPMIQLVIGFPLSQPQVLQRRGTPWGNSDHPLQKKMRAECWSMRNCVIQGIPSSHARS